MAIVTETNTPFMLETDPPKCGICQKRLGSPHDDDCVYNVPLDDPVERLARSFTEAQEAHFKLFGGCYLFGSQPYDSLSEAQQVQLYLVMQRVLKAISK